MNRDERDGELVRDSPKKEEEDGDMSLRVLLMLSSAAYAPGHLLLQK